MNQFIRYISYYFLFEIEFKLLGPGLAQIDSLYTQYLNCIFIVFVFVCALCVPALHLSFVPGLFNTYLSQIPTHKKANNITFYICAQIRYKM